MEIKIDYHIIPSQGETKLMSNWKTVESKEECTQATSKSKIRNGEQSSAQATEIQSNWISPELLEVIESVPYHKHFIHTYEGALPRR